MSNTIRLSIPPAGVLFAAPRQIWLATLGAAAVTRDWAQKEAGTVFRTLVKEGSAAESQALRVVGNRVETSMKRASTIASQARANVRSSVDALTSAATTLVQQRLAASHARRDVETAATARKGAAKSAKRAGTTRRASKARTQK
jgi:hypothetical protein